MIDRLEYAPCGILVLDNDGKVISVNKTLATTLGYDQSDLVGMHIERLLSPVSRIVYYSIFYPNIHLEGNVKELIIKCIDANGKEINFMLSARLTDTEHSQMIDCVLIEMTKRMQYEQELKLAQRQAREAYLEMEKLVAEIEYKQNELVKLNEKLTTLAITDKLTGLKNRRFFQERLEQLYEQFIDVKQHFCILVIDIDYFKKVNDTYGHHAGDEVLAQLGERIQTITSDQLEAFRYGGEEFVVLLTSDDDDYVKATAERIRYSVEAYAFTVGPITVSIGGAKIKPNMTASALFDLADKALYRSKQNGRNQVTFFM